jgi:hypothetical protein
VAVCDDLLKVELLHFTAGVLHPVRRSKQVAPYHAVLCALPHEVTVPQSGHAKYWRAALKSGEVEEDSLGSSGLGVDAVHLDEVPLLIVWPVELQTHVKSELCMANMCRGAGLLVCWPGCLCMQQCNLCMVSSGCAASEGSAAHDSAG